MGQLDIMGMSFGYAPVSVVELIRTNSTTFRPSYYIYHYLLLGLVCGNPGEKYTLRHSAGLPLMSWTFGRAWFEFDFVVPCRPGDHGLGHLALCDMSVRDSQGPHVVDRFTFPKLSSILTSSPLPSGCCTSPVDWEPRANDDYDYRSTDRETNSV